MKAQYTIDQECVRLSATNPIRSQFIKVDRPVAPHDHEFMEVCIVLNGSASHQTSDSRRTLRRNDVLIVPRNAVHAINAPSGLEVVNVYYLAEWFLPELNMAHDGDGLIPLFFPSAAPQSESGGPQVLQFKAGGKDIARVLEEIAAIRTNVSPRWVSCCLFKALLLLCRAYAETGGLERKNGFSGITWRVFLEVERRVDSGERLDLASLARSLDMSRDHLTRIFRTETGGTPLAFYEHRRLQFACRLLLDSSSNVAAIAHRLGYCDEPHFCRHFRRAFGFTPGQYRRRFAPTAHGAQIGKAA